MLTPEELETVLAEARAEDRLFRVRQSCTVVSAEGELRDCYAEVVLRSVIHKVRSMAQWEELKAQVRHVKETVHPAFW